LPRSEGSDVIEVERIVSRAGTGSLAGHVLIARRSSAVGRVGIRIEPSVLMFYVLDTTNCSASGAARWPWTRPTATTIGRARSRAAPRQQLRRDHGLRQKGRPRSDPQTRNRHRARVETTLAIGLPDTDTQIVCRTTTQPMRSIKGQRPRTATPDL
jgi:hypothetical protein